MYSISEGGEVGCTGAEGTGGTYVAVKLPSGVCGGICGGGCVGGDGGGAAGGGGSVGAGVNGDGNVGGHAGGSAGDKKGFGGRGWAVLGGNSPVSGIARDGGGDGGGGEVIPTAQLAGTEAALHSLLLLICAVLVPMMGGPAPVISNTVTTKVDASVHAPE